MNKLKQIYYKLKYRNIATSVAIIESSKKNKNDFGAACEEYAKTLKPCYKTNAEVLEYIKNKYGLRKEKLTTAAAEGYKINYIVNQHSELLSTPEPHCFTGDKIPSRKVLLEQHEIIAKRIDEARAYPLEKLGLSLELYKFDYALSDGYVAEFTILVDNTNDRFTISSSVNRKTTDEEQAIIHKIHEEIDMYKGIAQEDIDNRTPRFLGYVSILIRQDKTSRKLQHFGLLKSIISRGNFCLMKCV